MAADTRALGLLLLILAGCQPHADPAERETRAPEAVDPNTAVVLAIGDRRVTLAELARVMGPAPAQRLRITEAERRRAFLTDFERTELLALRARELGYFRDPAIVAARERALVAALLADLFGEHGSELAEVTDADVRARYERDMTRWTTPERVRARHIQVREQAKAERLLAEIAKAPSDPTLFTKLAHEQSLDVRTRERGGDLGWFALAVPPPVAADAVASASLLPIPVPASVRAAAFELSRAGDLARSVVKSDVGYHVLQLLGRQPSSRAELPQVARLLKEELQQERAEAGVEAFTSQLAARANVRVNDAALAHVRVPH